MKSFKIKLLNLLFLFILFFLPFLSFSTPPNPQIQSTSSQGIYQYSISNLPTGVTNAFWILGDGHFRTGLSPIHELGNNYNATNSTHNPVQVYMLEDYKPIPPTKLVCGGNSSCPNSSNSNQSAFPVLMGQHEYVKLGTSWNPKSGEKHYTIITIENKGTHSSPSPTLSGTVEIEFFDNIHANQVRPIDNNSYWFSNIAVSNNSNLNSSNVTFDFSNLSIGEQRHLLIETELIPNLESENLVYHLKMNSLTEPIYEGTANTKIRKHPYDPNNKEVSENIICAYNNQQIELEYRIDFQNIGNDYATNVRIKDVLPNHLDYSSFQITGSSFPCLISQSPQSLELLFIEILLPGLDQTFPYIPHPNETKGFVTFTINTEPCLEEMVLENMASIYFDELPAIQTPYAETEVLFLDMCWHTNVSCEPTNDDDDDDDDEEEEEEVPGPPSSNFINNTPIVEIYPNPFDESLVLNLSLTDNDKAYFEALSIVNIRGEEIINLSKDIFKGGGTQSVNINTNDWSDGIYFVKLVHTNETKTWKIIKIKE